MRIRVFDRIILVVVILILLTVTLGATVMAWRLVPETFFTEWVRSIYGVDENMWIVTGIAAFILIMTIGMGFIAFGPGRKGKSISYITIGDEETGGIRVAVKSLREMICRHVMLVQGVKSAESRVMTAKEKKIAIIIKIAIEEGTVIPTVCSEIQQRVKENIEAMAGVSIARIDVLIDNKES